MIEPIVLTLVGATMIAAAVYDAATLTIPNWISLVLVALFPIAAFSAGLNWTEAGIHFAVGFAALLAGMGLFATGAIGGGDAKLFAAIALYAGAADFAPYILAVALAGGGLAGALFAVRWAAAFDVYGRMSWLKHIVKTGAGIPYGVAIAGGGLFVLPATRLFMIAPQ
jgi:prepilin peptidase CpaA